MPVGLACGRCELRAVSGAPKPVRQFALRQMFTDEELATMVDLYCDCKPGEFAARASAEVVTPVTARINETTGQENEPLYIAYAVEHALSLSAVAYGKKRGFRRGGPKNN